MNSKSNSSTIRGTGDTASNSVISIAGIEKSLLRPATIRMPPPPSTLVETEIPAELAQ